MTTRARWRAALALFAGTAAITASAGNLSFLDSSPLAYFKPEDHPAIVEDCGAGHSPYVAKQPAVRLDDRLTFAQ